MFQNSCCSFIQNFVLLLTLVGSFWKNHVPESFGESTDWVEDISKGAGHNHLCQGYELGKFNKKSRLSMVRSIFGKGKIEI